MIAQHRMGVLPIQIELDRYRQVPRNQRICTLCNEKVECKLHFLYCCKNLSSIRNILIERDLMLSLELDTYRLLCKKPYIMGNLLLKLWQEQIKLKNI